MKKIVSILTLITLAGCSSAPKLNPTRTRVFTMEAPPVIGKTLSGDEIKLGGFSGLSFIGEKEGDLFFQTITDRGPNSPTNNGDRPFLLPEFTPSIITLRVNEQSGTVNVENTIYLHKSQKEKLSGLPNSRNEENPLDVFGLINSIDPEGMDTEAFVPNDEGGWWVAEEYAPSLAYFDEQGKLKRRLTPDNELPRQYKNRRPNRGFEAIARNGQKLYGFLQSPVSKDIDYSLIVELNLEDSRTSAEYLYVFEKGNDKIGDAVHVKNNKFLVIEQNGRTDEKAQKAVFLIEPQESDKPVKKTLLLDLAKTDFKNKEKIEGMAYIPGRGIALVFDNDFQIAGETDFKTGKTPLNDETNQLMIIDLNLDSIL